MSRILISLGVLASLTAMNATADTYKLSPDGTAVVRLVSSSPIAASTFDSSLLPAGYTSSTATGGSLAITTYEAGYKGGGGGGHIEALYTPATAPPAGSTLKWVQVGNDNDPAPGYPSPYLDSSAASRPFYGGSNATLPSGNLPFYDFSRRPPAHLSTINPINWSANLYPSVVDSNKNIKIYDGVSWGWNMKKAPVGNASAIFTNPTPAGATVTGVGTSNFSWGTGDPSSLSFAGAAFDTTPGTKFKIGTLTFHNGAINANTGADSVDFEAPIKFTNIPELNFTFKTKFTLVNTPNTPDPIASADQVTIGDFGYTFNVLEGATASVDIMMVLDTSLVGTPGKGSVNYSDPEPGPLDPSPIFTIGKLSLANPTGGGFVTQVPEPSTWLLLLSGMVAILCRKRFV
jgi:hypothetical protein